MKIEQRIVLSNFTNVALMVFIGVFAFQALNLVLTKLRFVEIADDLNASFLEMRLSEKNYFLYKDQSALGDIQDKIRSANTAVEAASDDISRAVGQDNLRTMKAYLAGYSKAVDEAARSCDRKGTCEATLRAEGKRLREFSDSMTRLERARVGDIITNSKRMMLLSFIGIILSASLLGHYVSQKIVRSLRKVEGLAKSIAGGDFGKIDEPETGDEMGSVIHAVNFMSDELKNREDELLQSKKLASLGVLTAGVAHEITNPVNNISMIAQTYQEVYDSLGAEDRIGFMKKVENEADRIKEIVRNLLDFSKPRKAVLRLGDINAVVKKSLKLVQNALEVNKVEARLDLGRGLPALNIDENQIQQVFVNLFVNASQAMPDGGSLHIKSRHDRERGVVGVQVSDTGGGIPPEYLPHVFDPFFSTKGVGGTGLGLSVSYGIMKNHNGSIRVESMVGAGTIFTVELPVPGKREQEEIG